MGEFDVLEAHEAEKKNNRGVLKPICKLKFKMQTAVREDLLRYLQSGKQWRKSKMKTIRVVAAVIKAVNKTGESIILQPREVMENLKAAGNFREEKLKKARHHRRL